MMRTFREALVAGVLPNDVFSEIVRQTDAYLTMAQQSQHFASKHEVRRAREVRATEKAERHANATVYYVRLTGDRVKIGWTTNLDQRLRAFRARAADLLAIEPGDYLVETARHREFAHLRIGRSEDFRAEPDLLEHIASLASASRLD